VTLDPTPLVTGVDRDYALLFKLVTERAIEEHNRINGG
jgi:hypothetical protein